MSTKTGIPTAATYVFVNMLRKLRDDFHPEYLAAVFDVAAPTFRDTQAEAITVVRKFDIKTQTFQEFNQDFVTWAQGELKAGKSAKDAAAGWKLPSKYESLGYSGTVSPMMGGLEGRLTRLADEMKQ